MGHSCNNSQWTRDSLHHVISSLLISLSSCPFHKDHREREKYIMHQTSVAFSNCLSSKIYLRDLSWETDCKVHTILSKNGFYLAREHHMSLASCWRQHSLAWQNKGWRHRECQLPQEIRDIFKLGAQLGAEFTSLTQQISGKKSSSSEVWTASSVSQMSLCLQQNWELLISSSFRMFIPQGDSEWRD